MNTPHRSRPWILCVETRIDLLLSLGSSLERSGVGLSVVRDVDEAQCLFAEEDPSLVLVSTRGRGHIGEKMDRLRRMFPATPLYALVEGACDDSGREAVRHGAYGWLRAPLHEGALQRVLGAGFRDPALPAGVGAAAVAV